MDRLTLNHIRLPSQLAFDDRGQETVTDLPSCHADQHADRFRVQLDDLSELLVALPILEGHFVANLQAVSVELACELQR